MNEAGIPGPIAAAVRPDARRSGVVVGALFIIATAFLFLGEAFYREILDAPNVLDIAAARKPTVVLGLAIELVCILAMPLIGAFIYPVLRTVSVGMAMSYCFFRALEAVILITVALVNKFALVTLSEAQAAGADPLALDAAMHVIRAQNAWGETAAPVYNMAFAAGAVCLYAVLWRGRFVPRWIPAWGLLAIAALVGVVVASIFMPIPPMVGVALLVPIAVQEMVMALWFIVRGFDVGGLARRDAAA